MTAALLAAFLLGAVAALALLPLALGCLFRLLFAVVLLLVLTTFVPF